MRLSLCWKPIELTERRIKMTSYDYGFRIGELDEKVKKLKKELCELKKRIVENDELWDNSDMSRRWGVSVRMIASWRSDKIIDYVQVGSKIWYTKEARENFLSLNLKYRGND